MDRLERLLPDMRLYRSVLVALFAMVMIVLLTLLPPYLGLELERRQLEQAYQWIALIAGGLAAKSAVQHSGGALTGVLQALLLGPRREGPWTVGPGATATRTEAPPVSADTDTDTDTTDPGARS